MLNEKIKTLRLAGNFSQVNIAEKLSVTKQTVSNWENNNIQPSLDMLVKIADLFGVSTDSLLGRDTSPKLDVSGLSEIEIQHLNMIINDIRNKNPQV